MYQNINHIIKGVLVVQANISGISSPVLLLPGFFYILEIRNADVGLLILDFKF